MNSAAEFRFTVINDLHYINADCRPWLRALVREINASGSELVLVLGDLAETGAREELASAREILNALTVPYYTVPGNHDGPEGRAAAGAAADGAATRSRGLAVYEELFPGRRNYSFTHKGWQFVALDTTDGSGYQLLQVTPETRAFARQAAAALNPAAPTILFTHFPLDPTVKYSLADGYVLLEDLARLNLRMVFSGHFHGLTENIAPERFGWPGLKLLTNRCVSRTRELHDNSNVRGYFKCVARKDGAVEYRFVAFAGIVAFAGT